MLQFYKVIYHYSIFYQKHTVTLSHIHSGYSCSEQPVQASIQEYWVFFAMPKRPWMQMQRSSFAYKSAIRAYCRPSLLPPILLWAKAFKNFLGPRLQLFDFLFGAINSAVCKNKGLRKSKFQWVIEWVQENTLGKQKMCLNHHFTVVIEMHCAHADHDEN